MVPPLTMMSLALCTMAMLQPLYTLPFTVPPLMRSEVRPTKGLYLRSAGVSALLR